MFALRGWRVSMWMRRLGLGRNSMRRPSDRVESAVFSLLLMLAIVAVPLGIHVGQTMFQTQSSYSVEQTQQAHQTTAVLLDNAPSGAVVPGQHQGVEAHPTVRAQWKAPDGSQHFGLVEANFGAGVGSSVPVWTDGRGELTEAPATSFQIHVRAAVLGISAGIGWLLALVAAHRALCWALDRRRLARWGEEWATVERVWRRQKP
jgi:hypothetical protein